MKNIIHITPITQAEYTTYIEVGTKGYNQHYIHLWPDRDSTPYIQGSFTNEVLLKEETDPNTILFLIYKDKQAAGVLKLTIDCPLAPFSGNEALLINKIYLLNEFSGKGIGEKILQFITLRAKELNKKIIWLESMQKGPALKFYFKNGFEIHGDTKVPFTNVIEEEKPMYLMVKKIDC